MRIACTVRGEGPPVVLVPSLGRGAGDFDDLGRRLAQAGFTAAAMDCRGVGKSTGPMDHLTLHDYARDVALVIACIGGAPAHVVGHAFGNRVARCAAADAPALVRSVTLLAAGGQVEPDADAWRALARVFRADLPDADHLAAVATAFFAPGHDPAVWRDGWWPEAAAAQRAAVAATDPHDFRGGGDAPMLIVQGLGDRVAPPANGRALRDESPGRVRLVEIADAGHALLPEQPEAVAAAVLDFLRLIEAR